MPPFIPTKRSLSPQEQTSPPAKRPAINKQVVELLEGSDSSLSDVSSDEEWLDVPKPAKKSIGTSAHVDNADNGDHDDDSVDWEDAVDSTTPGGNASHSTPAQNTPIQDLELTLDPVQNASVPDFPDTKKGPSKIERVIRLNTHRMHVQCLLFHNAIRNSWVNDTKVHDILRAQLPAGIKKEIQRWRVASALELPPKKDETTSKTSKRKEKKDKQRADARNWGDDAKRLEPGQPDMSNGDPLIQLLRILAAYWKKNFKVTAPGIRKNGYRSAIKLESIVSSLRKDEHNPLIHGECIRDRDEFRVLADKRQGSRDTGAQLFTALLRALGIEARLVSNLQPLGFGWTKSELDTSISVQTEAKSQEVIHQGSSDEELETDEEVDGRSSSKAKNFDSDLPFPIYWTEAISPITHEVIAVDPMVLSNQVAVTPEMVAAFEPRGALAEKAKQVIAYVIAHNSDGTAKDVTTRYLKHQMWPGKTKGYRLPMEKVPIRLSRRGPTITVDYDWFQMTMRGYRRSEKQRTAVDDIEDTKDLVPKQPERKVVKKEGDTLQSLKASTEFVLERFLRREEALRPGAKVVRKFASGKGDKAKEENVYRRADVVKCLSAESWHKEGRRPKIGEVPLKRVPIRAVTLMRKREVDEVERETGKKPLQGLYANYQTEFIVPPPIQNGVIPKNEYGNIDCFVPSMVPRGATHIPWGGTVRICKKLGIDYAEAVTGFEFGSKMAVPVIEGVVVAEENADAVKDAWRADQELRREKERLAQEKRILQTWRKFVMGLRIMERVRAEYGDDGDAEIQNPFQRRGQTTRSVETVDKSQESGTHEHEHEHEHEEDDHEDHENAVADYGGGFLLPGQDDEANDFVVEHGDESNRQLGATADNNDDVEVNASSLETDDFEVSSSLSEEDYKPPPRNSNRRRRRGG